MRAWIQPSPRLGCVLHSPPPWPNSASCWFGSKPYEGESQRPLVPPCFLKAALETVVGWWGRKAMQVGEDVLPRPSCRARERRAKMCALRALGEVWILRRLSIWPARARGALCFTCSPPCSDYRARRGAKHNTGSGGSRVKNHSANLNFAQTHTGVNSELQFLDKPSLTPLHCSLTRARSWRRRQRCAGRALAARPCPGAAARRRRRRRRLRCAP
jgi:hypothetical protein